MQWTPGKKRGLDLISDDQRIILATAMDQRGSLGKMIHSFNADLSYEEGLSAFKEGVASVLGNRSASLLLDPEYGWNAAEKLNDDVGLIMAYEKTGYDTTQKGRLPRLVDQYAVQDFVKKGVSALKLLIYYDTEEEAVYNKTKQAFIKRVGDECKQNDLLFILEPVSYSAQGLPTKEAAFTRRKPAIVEHFMEEFSKPKYGVDLLKVEVPVAIYHIEGYDKYDNYEPLFSAEEAADYYRICSEKSRIPFIYLSGGVTNEQFVDTMYFAKRAGSRFNGVLCGRAIWKDGVERFATEGKDAFYNWLETTGTRHLEEVKAAVKETATPWDKWIE
ncbi:MAG TPA: tagatose 1,6-diphosphate aldolase [Bacillota bacterium]|nr:tagatose 1,6-diphosphate aldolase [Bacillota bacterium]